MSGFFLIKNLFIPIICSYIAENKKQMIQNGVFILKQDATVTTDMSFPKGQEFEMIAGVIYMGGFPLQTNLQSLVKNWMDNNQNLFLNDTRNF